MWKKVIPVAAVLILAWIGLNLITAKDEEESVANAPDAAPSEVVESSEDGVETVSLAKNAPTDVAPESAPVDEEPAEVAATDEEPPTETVADAVPADATTDTDTSDEQVTEAEEVVDSVETADSGDASDSSETTDTGEAADSNETADSSKAADSGEAADSSEAAASADEETTAETTEAGADAPDASADDSGSTVAMRYPTDPVTGASIYDQGMVEVVIEPAVAPVEEDNDVAAEESADTAQPASEEVAATEPEETVEPVTITRTAMRYPTDSVTGATIYDQGMVEVAFESLVEPGEEGAEAAQDQASNAAEASDTKASAEGQVSESAETAEGTEGKGNVQMRYPTDPVTGATIYDQGMVEVAVEADGGASEEVAENAEGQVSENAETAEGTEGKGNVQMRYPTDPVTGATIYDQGMVEVAVESDGGASEEVAENAEGQAAETAAAGKGAEGKGNVQMRYPTDPVTGATIYDQGMVEVVSEGTAEEVVAESTDSSSEDATETAESDAPAEPTEDTAGGGSAEVETGAETQTATTTGAVAAIAERGTFSLGSISRTLGGVFGTATTVLSGARDEASAQAVLPRLEKASASLNSVVDQFATLPEYAKGPLAKVVKRGMSRLKPLADTALTREGVGPVLMPVMGPMLESMQAMLR